MVKYCCRLDGVFRRQRGQIPSSAQLGLEISRFQIRPPHHQHYGFPCSLRLQLGVHCLLYIPALILYYEQLALKTNPLHKRCLSLNRSSLLHLEPQLFRKDESTSIPSNLLGLHNLRRLHKRYIRRSLQPPRNRKDRFLPPKPNPHHNFYHSSFRYHIRYTVNRPPYYTTRLWGRQQRRSLYTRDATSPNTANCAGTLAREGPGKTDSIE